jgi:hypothetical protein
MQQKLYDAASGKAEVGNVGVQAVAIPGTLGGTEGGAVEGFA